MPCIKQLTQTNFASRAPTKDYLTHRGQALLDQNFDRRLLQKSARLGKYKWISWNFDGPSPTEISTSLMAYLIDFMRVRVISVVQKDGKNFGQCECLERTRCGLPCSCFLGIADNGLITIEKIVDIGMVDCRYLKMYVTSYGSDTAAGDLMHDAQVECFAHEHDGIKITDEFYRLLIDEEGLEKTKADIRQSGGDVENELFPILGPNTTMNDFEEAEYVMSVPTCTKIDLELYRMEKSGDITEVRASLKLRDNLKKHMTTEEVVLSKMASDMKKN